MLCYVMLCCVMLCYVRLCYVMLWYVILCYVMLCYVMLCMCVCVYVCMYIYIYICIYAYVYVCVYIYIIYIYIYTYSLIADWSHKGSDRGQNKSKIESTVTLQILSTVNSKGKYIGARKWPRHNVTTIVRNDRFVRPDHRTAVTTR